MWYASPWTRWCSVQTLLTMEPDFVYIQIQDYPFLRKHVGFQFKLYLPWNQTYVYNRRLWNQTPWTWWCSVQTFYLWNRTSIHTLLDYGTSLRVHGSVQWKLYNHGTRLVYTIEDFGTSLFIEDYGTILYINTLEDYGTKFVIKVVLISNFINHGTGLCIHTNTRLSLPSETCWFSIQTLCTIWN
jgi:hypothetical protein